MPRRESVPEMTRDELAHAFAAPIGTVWESEIRQMEAGAHPDPKAFLESVRRLTRVAWTFADHLEDSEQLAEVNERTYREYLWFMADANP